MVFCLHMNIQTMLLVWMILDLFSLGQGDIPIYAHRRVLNALHKRFEYIFETKDRYPGAPSVIEHVITNSPFMLQELEVIPINVMHGALQVFGFRFKDFAYLTDVKTIAKEEIEKLRGVKGLSGKTRCE